MHDVYILKFDLINFVLYPQRLYIIYFKLIPFFICLKMMWEAIPSLIIFHSLAAPVKADKKKRLDILEETSTVKWGCRIDPKL